MATNGNGTYSTNPFDHLSMMRTDHRDILNGIARIEKENGETMTALAKNQCDLKAQADHNLNNILETQFNANLQTEKQTCELQRQGEHTRSDIMSSQNEARLQMSGQIAELKSQGASVRESILNAQQDSLLHNTEQTNQIQRQLGNVNQSVLDGFYNSKLHTSDQTSRLVQQATDNYSGIQSSMGKIAAEHLKTALQESADIKVLHSDTRGYLSEKTGDVSRDVQLRVAEARAILERQANDNLKDILSTNARYFADSVQNHEQIKRQVAESTGLLQLESVKSKGELLQASALQAAAIQLDAYKHKEALARQIAEVASDIKEKITWKGDETQKLIRDSETTNLRDKLIKVEMEKLVGESKGNNGGIYGPYGPYGIGNIHHGHHHGHGGADNIIINNDEHRRSRSRRRRDHSDAGR